ncbi:MAG: energy-coupling factor transporter ATPase [Eggerthellaceae bacterium]
MITFEHASFTYPSGTKALDDVSLTIGKGEFACLLGGNGSGKSTLAKHMNALLFPSEGTVRICGMDTRDPKALFPIRSKVGMVFQNPEDQLVASPVENEVAFGPENLGLPPQEIRSRVTWALESVGLAGFEQRDTAALSGGQKQRLAIAGALAMHPQVLILDEASAMLDPRGRIELMEVCKKLHSHGMTIIMVTHSMDEASCAERVIILDRGRIAAQGSPDEVLRDEGRLREFKLEAPFSVKLACALQRRGVPAEASTDTRRLIGRLIALKEDRCSR